MSGLFTETTIYLELKTRLLSYIATVSGQELKKNVKLKPETHVAKF